MAEIHYDSTYGLLQEVASTGESKNRNEKKYGVLPSGRCRSQWPCGLRRRYSAPRLLRSWFRIQPGAWMFVCCVLSGKGLCDGLITRPEESYQLWRVFECDQETSKTRRLKSAPGLWKIQPKWVVTTGKQTNKQTNLLAVIRNFRCVVEDLHFAPLTSCCQI